MSRLLHLLPVAFLLLPSYARALEPLPPDEQAAFSRSVHEIIGCESCHLPGLPDSIPRGEIPRVCGDCHPNPFKDYTLSVHWKDLGAVCADCHGAHDITLVRRPDSRAYRSLVCGACHIGPKEHFDRGPHREGMERTGALACASCHSNHNVQRPTIARIEPACAGCHPKTTPEFRMGQQVEALFSGLQDSLALAQARIDRAAALGLNTRRPGQALQEARAGFTRARLVWHGLQTAEIEAEVQQAAGIARQATSQASELLAAHRLRRIGLAAFWAFILANIALLYLKKRRIERA